MKILLHGILLLVGINLIVARYVSWDTHMEDYDDYTLDYQFSKLEDEILETPRQPVNEHEEALLSFESLQKARFDEFLRELYGDSTIDSDEKKVNNDDNHDEDNNDLNLKEDKEEDEIVDNSDEQSLFRSLVLPTIVSMPHGILYDNNQIKAKQFNDYESDSDWKTKVNNDDNNNVDHLNSKEDKEEEYDEIVNKSNEQIPIQTELLHKSSEESNETLTSDQDNVVDADETKHVKQLSAENSEDHDEQPLTEKDIRELTALLVTLSTIEDLIKITENHSEENKSQNPEELYEQKLKEVNDYFNFFDTVLDNLLQESSESEKDAEKTENDDDDNKSKDNENKLDDDNDNKDDDSKDDNENEGDDDEDDDNKEETVSVENNNNDDDNEDASVPFEFHSIDENEDDDDKDDDDKDDDNKEETVSVENNNNDDDNEDASVPFEFHSIDTQDSVLNTQNMNNHRYDVIKPSSTTDSPYTTETNDLNKSVIIHEYVEERETLDLLQENLLTNKMNMDKDFYQIINNNESDSKDMQKFSSDLATMRENIFKIRQSLDAIQDVKSKLYFHQLIKSAVNGEQIF